MTANELLVWLGGGALLSAFVLGVIVGVYMQVFTHRCPKWGDPNPAKHTERGSG